MAIGYSGTRAQTMLLKVDSKIGGESQNIYIHTIMNQLKPLLKVPFILNMIKNTNNSDGTNQFANSRYYYNIKNKPATKISEADESMIADPRKIESEDIKVWVKDLAPVEYAKKMSGSIRDLQTQGLENIAAISVSDFIEQRRIIKQIEIWNEAIASAQKVQTDNFTNIDSFENGAHLVQKEYTSSDDIYNDLSSAIESFQTFGLENSTSEFNRNIPYVLGINRSDMLILISPKAAGLLLGKPGLFASDPGNELFRKMNLKEFLGVPMLIEPTLPSNTNFLIITTGIHGAIGYEECGNVSFKNINNKNVPVIEGEASMVLDPNWSGFYRIDISDVYKSGIVFNELILVSKASVNTKEVKKESENIDNANQ